MALPNMYSTHSQTYILYVVGSKTSRCLAQPRVNVKFFPYNNENLMLLYLTLSLKTPRFVSVA